MIRQTPDPDHSISVATGLSTRYRALAVMPTVIEDMYAGNRPSADPERVKGIGAGAAFLAAVLCEYAQLVEMETNFPDVPRLD